MKQVLKSEIKKEVCNAAALGAVNAVLAYRQKYQGKTYSFKIGKNDFGSTVAVRYANGQKTNFSFPLMDAARNIQNQ